MSREQAKLRRIADGVEVIASSSNMTGVRAQDSEWEWLTKGSHRVLRPGALISLRANCTLVSEGCLLMVSDTSEPPWKRHCGRPGDGCPFSEGETHSADDTGSTSNRISTSTLFPFVQEAPPKNITPVDTGSDESVHIGSGSAAQERALDESVDTSSGSPAHTGQRSTEAQQPPAEGHLPSTPSMPVQRAGREVLLPATAAKRQSTPCAHCGHSDAGVLTQDTDEAW